MTPSKPANATTNTPRTERGVDLQAAYLVLIRAYFRRLSATGDGKQTSIDATPPLP